MIVKNILLLTLNIQMIISSYKYKGVEGYGTIDKKKVLNPDSKIYRFLKDKSEEEVKFKIYPGNINVSDLIKEDFNYKCEDGAYPIQNKLVEEYDYDLTLEDDVIKKISQITKVNNKYENPIKNTPGKKTLKNFISTAFQPLGTTLYVFGGGWDFQDVGTSFDGRTIGISKNWIKFFDDQTVNYTYRDDSHKESTYYPFNGFNEYYYAGLDCSGFVGWTLYNTFYKENLKHNGFVQSAKKIAKDLADKKYGKWLHKIDNSTNLLLAKELKVGDIISTPSHVMIVLGKCDDDSFIIIHSTPSDSKTGNPGGGVQISAVNPKESGSKNCKAYELCLNYTTKYFKKWSERYEPTVIGTDRVFNFPDSSNTTGIFHWEIKKGVLEDPEKYAQKNASEILIDLFKEKPFLSSGSPALLIVIISALGVSLLLAIIIIIVIKIKKSRLNNESDGIDEGLMK